MLTITALTDAEYLISSVALSIDEYYAGVGESPGVWAGRWAPGLGLSGMVEADQLRALVEGRHPGTGVELPAGHRDRTVRAFDLTLSAPKSVSLLWALGSEPVAEVAAQAHRDAVAAALGFLEERTAVARRQERGVRRRVETNGWVVAGFVHRTSREGDPQLHSHCLVPNLVQRTGDGNFVALDGGPLYDWCRAAGSVYQNELQRLLSLRLGVVWGPDRNNTREMVGLTRQQLRAFSKRSAQIEAELERRGAKYESPVLRLRADDEASLATRTAKDHSLTPTLLAGRWRREAVQVGLAVGEELDRAVCFAEPDLTPATWEELTAALVDEERGLCARSARFTESDVVEHLCALSGGRLTMDEIVELAARFLSSGLAVRLTPSLEGGRRRPPEWSTAAHRELEDNTLTLIERLAGRTATPVSPNAVTAALSTDVRLGEDQIDAVRALCGAGGSLRAVLAPAGYGKTAMAHAAASAASADGRPVVAVATTAKAVAEMTEAGLRACTIAQLRIDLAEGGLAPGTVVLLDELSQTPTRDAYTVLAAVADCREGMAWVVGDPRQSQPVAAGGVADEIERRVEAGDIPAGRLRVNRRQIDQADREALGLLRRGRAAESQQLRGEHGWEHEHATPSGTREAMADALCAAIAVHGAPQVAALAVSHVDAEDVADRIRERLAAAGALSGPALVGPGWATDRQYRAGDRVLLHARCGRRDDQLINGTTATVEQVDQQGLTVRLDNGAGALLPASFVHGARRDGSPNLSHAWCRTVDGAQGGTWDACHLLGSSALDAFRGYSGQSRSRLPTHTWNTATVTAVDHGGMLADRRSPAEQVAVALARQPDPTLAARRDPFVIEHRLLEQIRAHQAVLAGQLPDRSAAVARAEKELTALRDRQSHLESVAAYSRQRLDGIGTFHGLGRQGRAERRLWQQRLHADLDAVEQHRSVLATVAANVEQLRGEQDARDRFERAQSWRREELAVLRDRVDHHWSDVIVGCVRADDPLAYGIDKLRHARQMLSKGVRQVDAGIPADRDGDRHRARRDLLDAAASRRDAERDLSQAQERLELAGRRRWGRRDHDAVAQAGAEASYQRYRLNQATQTEQTAGERHSQLSEHQQRRRLAHAASAERRAELTAALESVDGALDQSRPERVRAMVGDPPDYLRSLIGPAPSTESEQAQWLRVAEKVEAQLDRHGPDSAAWRDFCRDLHMARAPVDQQRVQAPAPRRAPEREHTMPTYGYRQEVEGIGGPGLGL